MATFVLVHGSWGGGWQWRRVADRLRAAGHQVTTPTLTGLGERAHVSPDGRITLETHIEDLVGHLYFEDLTDVVLVGWSYGSAIVEAAADRSPNGYGWSLTSTGMSSTKAERSNSTTWDRRRSRPSVPADGYPRRQPATLRT